MSTEFVTPPRTLNIYTDALWLLVPLVVLFYFVWRLLRFSAPFRLIPRGEYRRARALYDEMGRSWWRVFPGVRDVSAYGSALCLGLEGDLEASLAAMRNLARPVDNPPLCFGIDTSIASTLILLEREHREVVERLERSLETLRAPDLLLGLAHAHLSLEERDVSERLYAEAIALPAEGHTKVGTRAIVRRDVGMVAHGVDALRGWYLLRVGEVDEAKPFLESAAQHPVPSPTRDLARRLLGVESPHEADDDTPPSLVAVVVPKS